VRELEARARAGAAERQGRSRRPRVKPALHPDQEAAIERIADSLGAALGCEVEVTPGRDNGYRVQISFQSLEAALELTRRLGLRSAA
jgi:hypothetical protein